MPVRPWRYQYPTVVRDKDNDIDTDRFIHSLTHWQTIHSLVAREEVA